MSDEDKKDYTRAVDRCPDPVLKAKAISIFKNGTNTEKLRVTKEILKLIADREAKQNAQDADEEHCPEDPRRQRLAQRVADHPADGEQSAGEIHAWEAPA